MATSTSANTKLAYLIPIYYDRRMLERMVPQLLYHQFGEKKELPKNEGQSVYWHRWNAFGKGHLLTESAAGTARGMSATRVSATLLMVGDHVVTTTYIDMVSINSIVQGAVDLFADSAALTLDFITSRQLLWKMTSVSATLQVSAAAAALGTRWWSLSGGTGIKAETCSASIFQAPVWSINDLTTRLHAFSALRGGSLGTSMTPLVLRKVALKLKVKNALPFDDGYYKAIIHPDIVNQLRSSSAFIDLHKYVESGASTFVKGTLREGGERGLVGVLERFKFYESTEAPLFSTSGVLGGTANGQREAMSSYGEGRLYFSFFFGKYSYGVTDFDGGIRTFVKTPGPNTTSDPLSLINTVGYRLIFTSKILNPSACLWIVHGRPYEGVGA